MLYQQGWPPYSFCHFLAVNCNMNENALYLHEVEENITVFSYNFTMVYCSTRDFCVLCK